MTGEPLIPSREGQLSPLPLELEPLFNLDNSLPLADGLRRLPFVPASAVVRDYDQPVISLGTSQVPVERIVCSPRDMGSWAAEGSVKLLADGSEEATFDRAASMVRDRSYNGAPKPMIVSLFRDNAGEIWCKVIDGTHRVIAAKMNSERSVEAVVRATADVEAMDRYPGDVVAEALQLKDH